MKRGNAFMEMGEVLKVLIVRDRRCAGGGIYGYFEAIRPHLTCNYRFCDTGRPQGYYGGESANRWLTASGRVVCDWLRLGWTILRFRPEIVHLNAGLDREERSLKREAVSIRIARLLGCRVLVFWHGWDHPAKDGEQFPGGQEGWLWNSYVDASAHVVLATRFERDLKRWGFTAPVHLTTTAVFSELLEIDTKQTSAPSKRLLFLSRVEREKGVWELLEAYALLKASDTEYQLVIAGNGPDLAALQHRVAELALEDVIFPGFVEGERKLKYLREASIFCFPSYSEGMPLAVLEALAVGLPVVSSEVGGLRDILIDGKHGILLKILPEDSQGRRFDPEEIACAIKRLSDDPESCQAISRNNAAYARYRFSPEKIAGNLETIYRSLNTGDSGRRSRHGT